MLRLSDDEARRLLGLEAFENDRADELQRRRLDIAERRLKLAEERQKAAENARNERARTNTREADERAANRFLAGFLIYAALGFLQIILFIILIITT